MDRYSIYYMKFIFTLTVLLVGFGLLLSPPFRDLRIMLGLPSELYGARYNASVGAAEIINSSYTAAKAYLGRITFYYHSLFISLLYATIVVLIGKYLDEYRDILLNMGLIATIFTVVGGIVYGYFDRVFFWHGVFIAGLAFMFLTGLLILIKFKPKNLLEYNIQLSGILLIIGAIIGGWLGSSFMYHRDEFLNALINSRFNPDLSEGNIFWRSLTAHEHAMIAIALTLVFLIGVSHLKLKNNKATKASLYILYFGQLVMATAAYAVWFVGKVAHLVITPAAILLILGTLIVSIVSKASKGYEHILRYGLITINIVMWLGVALPGAIVAISLRKPIIFNPPFRDPIWDWAELSYNIGHWHILLLTWGVTLTLIYLTYTRYSLVGRIGGITTLIGYLISVAGINLYMLANPPGKYIPNPYNNIYLTYIVEPGLTILTIGIAITYIKFTETKCKNKQTKNINKHQNNIHG